MLIRVGLTVQARDAAWRTRLATPVAMAVGSLVFYAIVAYGRAAGFAPKFAEIGRYLHLVLSLPPSGRGLRGRRRRRRWRVLLVPVVAVFLIAVPANLAQVDTLEKPVLEGTKRDVLLVARPEAIEGLPPDLHPFPRNYISVGWLREQRAAGRIPDPAGPVTAVDDANTFHVIARPGRSRPSRLDACPCAGPWSECSARGHHQLQGPALHHDEAPRGGGSVSQLALFAGRTSGHRGPGRSGRGDDQTGPCAQSARAPSYLGEVRKNTRFEP